MLAFFFFFNLRAVWPITPLNGISESRSWIEAVGFVLRKRAKETKNEQKVSWSLQSYIPCKAGQGYKTTDNW